MAGLFHLTIIVVSPKTVNITPNGSLQAIEEKVHKVLNLFAITDNKHRGNVWTYCHSVFVN